MGESRVQEGGRPALGITADGQLAEGGTGVGIPEALAAGDRRMARSGGAKGSSSGRRGSLGCQEGGGCSAPRPIGIRPVAPVFRLLGVLAVGSEANGC